jgi:hypothetical protein
MNESSPRTCGHCGSATPPAVSWCPSCGTRLDDSPELRSPATKPEETPTTNRRAFLAAAGATLAVTAGAGFFTLRRRRATSAAAVDKSSRPAATKPEVEAETKAVASPVESYRPDRDRVYSLGSYEGLVVAAAPYRDMAQRAERAITSVKLRAVELDAFSNDVYWREPGQLVVLGEQDRMLVGFTHRYNVDRTYPSNSLNSDGFGTAEWGRHSLVVDKQRIDLHRLSPGERPSPSGERIAWEAIGDHDAAILYIPKTVGVLARLPRLGIPEPAKVVREAVRDSSKLFGLDFVLISPKSLRDLREGATSRMLTLQVFLAGIAVGALFFAPLLGQLAAGVAINESTLAQTGRRVLSKALPTLVKLAGRAMLDERGLRSRDGASRGLLGVEWPKDADGLAMIGKFFAEVLPAGEAQYVPYTGRGVRGGQLFVPERRMNVNAELLGRGLAKLDLAHLDALREHPQLVEAALGALDARRNLAAKWVEDEAYRRMVAMIQRG